MIYYWAIPKNAGIFLSVLPGVNDIVNICVCIFYRFQDHNYCRYDTFFRELSFYSVNFNIVTPNYFAMFFNGFIF